MPGGRPRTSSPSKEELIELGKDLVRWAEARQKKSEPLRARFCDWYTAQGFVRRQWEDFREKPEFSWYYERARTLLGLRYIDGTVNQSIAHRYLRIYDPEVRDAEDKDDQEAQLRKAAAIKGQDGTVTALALEILNEVDRHKRKPK